MPEVERFLRQSALRILFSFHHLRPRISIPGIESRILVLRARRRYQFSIG